MSSLLIRGGRVVDPATNTDTVTDLLVEDGHVAALGTGLQADQVLDASGLVVGPGFIDLHSHVHSIAGHYLQAFDGVTTALDLEAGLAPVAAAYATAAAEGRPLHYGFSASWAQARALAHLGLAPQPHIAVCLALMADEQWRRTSSPAERAIWLDFLRSELEAGALGIGLLLGYAPYTESSEYLDVARLAAEADVATFTHVRELVEADPAVPVDGPSEVAAAAASTGARMHHCHVNSTSRRHIDRVLTTLAKAQAEGSRVTVEAYPYGAGSTGVGAFFLDPDRLAAWGLAPSAIMLLPSGERIRDADQLRQVRAETPWQECVVEFLDEAVPADRLLLRRSLSFPDTIVASDAMPVLLPDHGLATREWPLPENASTHPRTAGTFSKTVRMMVRDSGEWTWLEAFRRCSYLPAQVLDFVPAAQRKGHLGVGADADLVVLDPTTFTDAATYLTPTQPAVGVRHLFVAGTQLIRDGELLPDTFPGQPLRGQPR